MKTIVPLAGLATEPPGFGDERLPERFWEKAQINSEGCWEWTAGLSGKGYGRFQIGDTSYKAHRIAYEALVGEIKDGLVIDHLCRVRRCVNPAHMEPVTNRENLRRGDGGINNLRRGGGTPKSHCVNGHPFSGENRAVGSRGHQRCRACQREWSRASRARKRAAQPAMSEGGVR